MAIAFDASTKLTGTTTFSGNHTPVGTPKGALVAIAVRNIYTDIITGVTYGGEAMTRVCFQGNNSAADTDGGAYMYFLGSGIPTGVQSVEVTTADGESKMADVITVTAAGDTELAGTTGFDTSNADSGWGTTFTMTVTGVSGASFGVSVIQSDENNLASVTVRAGDTESQTNDFGNDCAKSSYKSSASGNLTMGWGSSGQDPYSSVMAAIQEIATFTPKVMMF